MLNSGYNNTDSANPIEIGVINIHFNFNVAVKGNILYAGSYSDLLIFEISDSLKTVYINRELYVFSLSYECITADFDKNYLVKYVNMKEKVVLSWEVKTIEEEIENSNDRSISMSEDLTLLFSESKGFSSSGSCLGGSMSSFTIMNNTLYVLAKSSLKFLV